MSTNDAKVAEPYSAEWYARVTQGPSTIEYWMEREAQATSALRKAQDAAKMACANCRHFHEEAAHIGYRYECRRRAPVIVAGSTRAHWPEVSPANHCGEFALKPPKD